MYTRLRNNTFKSIGAVDRDHHIRKAIANIEYEKKASKIQLISKVSDGVATLTKSLTQEDLGSGTIVAIETPFDPQIIQVYDNNGSMVLPDEIFRAEGETRVSLKSFVPLQGVWNISILGAQ